MDTKTNELINNFITFLTLELKNHKHLKHLQFLKWTLNDFKIEITYINNDETRKVFVDLRELKDNPSHFSHLTNNIIDQIQQK